MHPSACGVCLLSAPGSASTRSQDLSPSKLATDNSSDICLSNIVTLGVVGRRKQPSHFQISQLKESELEGGRGGRQFMSSHRATQQLVHSSLKSGTNQVVLKINNLLGYLYEIPFDPQRQGNDQNGDSSGRWCQPTADCKDQHRALCSRDQVGTLDGDLCRRFPQKYFFLQHIDFVSAQKGREARRVYSLQCTGQTESWFTSESNFPGRFCLSTRSPELEVGEEGEFYLIEMHQPPFSENFVLTN